MTPYWADNHSRNLDCQGVKAGNYYKPTCRQPLQTYAQFTHKAVRVSTLTDYMAIIQLTNVYSFTRNVHQITLKLQQIN